MLGSLHLCPVALLTAHQHPHPTSLLRKIIHLYSMVVAGQEWAKPKSSHMVGEESHTAMGRACPSGLCFEIRGDQVLSAD